MDRACLFKLFEECNNDKAKIRKRLAEYFNTPEGKEVLADAPPHLFYDAEGKGKETTVDLVIDGLLQEVRVDG